MTTGYSADWQHIPPQACPWCGHTLDAVGQAHVEQCEQPASGDVTVCIRCVEVSVFEQNGTLRRARPEELDDELREAQEDIRRMQAHLN